MWVHNACNDSVTILKRQKISNHQVEVHTDKNGPHIHLDRGTKKEEYINVTDTTTDDAMKQLPKKLRKNDKVRQAVDKAKKRHDES